MMMMIVHLLNMSAQNVQGKAMLLAHTGAVSLPNYSINKVIHRQKKRKKKKRKKRTTYIS